MGTMNSLPDTAKPNSPSSHPDATPVGSMAKEAGPVGAISIETLSFAESGKDVALPKEVESAGVRVIPTEVTIHPDIQKLGVMPQGSGVTDTRPQRPPGMLSDDELAQGFREPVTSSFHWLVHFIRRQADQWRMRTYRRKVPVKI